MDVIGQNIAKLVDERLKEALHERDVKIQALEDEKRRLTRLASDMKNEVKNMRVTIAMYDNCMRKKRVTQVCHKGIQCDMYRGLPPYPQSLETNSSTSRSPKSENGETSSELNKDSHRTWYDENITEPEDYSSSGYSDKRQITSPMSLGERVNEPTNGDDPMEFKPLVNNDPAPLPKESTKNSRDTVEVIDLSDEENANDFDKGNQTGGLNNNDNDQVNYSIPRVKREFIPPKIEILPDSTKLQADGKHSTVFIITHESNSTENEIQNVDHYEVYMLYRKMGSSNMSCQKKIGTVRPSSPSRPILFNANHLQNGVEYRFRVKPVIAGDEFSERYSEDCVFYLP